MVSEQVIINNDKRTIYMLGEMFTSTAKSNRTLCDALIRYFDNREAHYTALKKSLNHLPTHCTMNNSLQPKQTFVETNPEAPYKEKDKPNSIEPPSPAKITAGWMLALQRRLEWGRGGDSKGENGDPKSNKFAIRLRALRESNNLTRKQLALKSNVPEEVITEYETGVWASEHIIPEYVNNLSSVFATDLLNEALGHLSKEEDE